MAALSSSSLFSAPRVLTNDEINTVLNAIINRNIVQHSLLLPSLNTDFVRVVYDEVNEEPNMTVHFVTSHSSFNIYFCKFDNSVYKVITDNTAQNVYYVSRISPLMHW